MSIFSRKRDRGAFRLKPGGDKIRPNFLADNPGIEQLRSSEFPVR